MADNYLNYTGLAYYHNRAKTIFGSKEDIQDLQDQIDAIDGIKTVKRNGTALVPDASKAVNVVVPEKTSELTNDGDGSAGSKMATEKYVTEALADIVQIEYRKVDALPETGENGVIYLVSNSGSSPNVYDEYIWVNSEKTIFTSSVTDSSGKLPADINDTFKNAIIPYTTKVAAGESARLDSYFINVDQIIKVNGETLKVGTPDQARSRIQVYKDGDTQAGVLGDVNFTPAEGTSYNIMRMSSGRITFSTRSGYAAVGTEVNITAGGYSFEKIGTTDVDLSQYWSKSELSAITTAQIDTVIGS